MWPQYCWVLSTLVLLCSCQGKKPALEVAKGSKSMAMTVTSTAFKEGEMIPARYTCDGKNISPPLEWTGVPANARSLAIICDDPDAPRGTWTHWIVYNLPADTTSMPEAVPTTETLANGAKQGKNSGDTIGYSGPCPPSGTHRYFFNIYALDNKPVLPDGATKEQLLHAMDGHFLGGGLLMGVYARPK